MGKVIFWIIVIFAVLLCLRLLNISQQKKARKKAADAPKPAQEMVRCSRCGVYMPRSEAMLIGSTLRCRDKNCA